MKKILYLHFILLLSASYVSSAQGLVERVYVQTDRQNYSPGETIHFIAYVITETDTLAGTDLFVELWDDNFTRLTEACVPTIEGTASGSLTIPDGNKSRQIYLRAYTSLSASQAIPFQFIKPVMGASPVYSQEPAAIPLFFPEGGKLVYNADNFVAYKTAPGSHGTIRNSKNETIIELPPAKQGLGSFFIHPIPGETYFFHGSDGNNERIALPIPTENGIAMHLRQMNDTLYFDIDNGGSKRPTVRKPKIQLLINNEIAYVVELNMLAKDKFSYFIPLVEFQPGLAELKIFGSDGQLLASRPVFIHRKSSAQNGALEIVKKDLNRRGENIYRIDLQDSTLRYVSVSVTDADRNDETNNPGIMSAFFAPGPMALPRMSDTAGYHTLLDLYLLTSGVNISNAPTAVASTLVTTNRYLRLTGVVKKGKRLVAEKEVLVGIRSAYTGKELHKVITDAQGKFVLDGLIIYGEAFVHCRLPGKSDDELTCEFVLSKPLAVDNPVFLDAFKQQVAALTAQYAAKPAIPGTAEVDTIVFAESSITLEEVVVKSDHNLATRKRLEDLEKKYVDGTAFGGYGATGETIDVINDPWSAKAFDLYSYIAQRTRSLTQRLVQGRRELFYFGRGVGGETMIQTFFLNNSRIDRDMLSGIRVDEVALIKFIPMLGSEQGFPPTIVIFLKKQGDQGYWEKDRYVLSEQTIHGYPVSKEFSVLDYSNEQVKVQQDLRKTLLWNPYLPVDKGVAEIRFYNSDITRKFRVVLEGTATDGSIIYFEKLIE